jgi:pyrroline-5-carboxylate reductase
MDAVTAVSGSGPAYFFFLVERLIEAGVAEGLTPEAAGRLARQTALGAAEMMLAAGDPPEELRRRVTSPGGTTEAAFRVLAERGVPEAFVAAVRRAAERSRELGRR